MIQLDDLARLPPSPERDELMRRELRQRYRASLAETGAAEIVSQAVRAIANEQIAHIRPDAPAVIAQRRRELAEAATRRTRRLKEAS